MNKTLILGVALATLTVAPALAQSFNPNLGTGNIVPATTNWQDQAIASDAAHSYMPSQATLDRLRGIRAQAMPTAAHDRVYVSGHYVGADPDPNVRLELRRDAPDFIY